MHVEDLEFKPDQWCYMASESCLCFSWYHESFDREMDIAGIRIPSLEMVIHFLIFSYARTFMHANGQGKYQTDQPLLPRWMRFSQKNWKINKHQMTQSHHLAFKIFLLYRVHHLSRPFLKPRQELCPEKRMLFYPNLPKIIGSDFLEVRIRYIQAPLAYPRERKRRMNGGETWLPFCVYSGGKFADRLSPCYWSDYYAAHPRAPHVTELAPWVARFYNRA
ncbi:hypothetical protein NC653_038788 [Populus alba x Populus x berolinensis]|uniref:Uncharacterized protein n=1 Tax=Populus alba x Populus x berolinensis TaxID=444605 RepID=A0AAD6LHR2_9ROSI|nr:hypothetical protein NC653_038788 [Populus alba x Populus x berolinensis]